MRTSFGGANVPGDEALRSRFSDIAARFNMDWQLHRADRRCRVLVAVSKQGHVLNNMLHRYSIGTLPIKIVGVVSNHETMRSLVEWHKLPFHYLPVSAQAKDRQEQQIPRPVLRVRRRSARFGALYANSFAAALCAT